MKVGTYTGAGGTSQAVSGAGFQPEYVAVLGAVAQRATQRFTGMTRGYQFDADTGTTTRITSLDSDGFSVGNSSEVKQNGQTYHYVAFNDANASIEIGNYTGSGGDNRNYTGVGVDPGYVLIRANDTGTARQSVNRGQSIAGDSTAHFGATANANNRIQSLISDGFQLGTDASVNTNTVPYHYLAVKNTGGGCSEQSEQAIGSAGDSWLDKGGPTSNLGNDSVLKVNSKSPANDMRALVTFNLPTVPAGCSVTGATLRLYNKSPISGRTLEALRNTAAWTEGAVNWNNQPATAAGAATAATPGSAGWMQWDVLTQVQAMYAGSNYGFKIKDQTENAGGIEQQFDSEESGSNLPQLVITIG